MLRAPPIRSFIANGWETTNPALRFPAQCPIFPQSHRAGVAWPPPFPQVVTGTVLISTRPNYRQAMPLNPLCHSSSPIHGRQ